MKYITGIHALNISCDLETCGDWHQSALGWEDLTIGDSSKSVFKDYGIELKKTIPNHTKTFPVANHIRALLDLLELGKFSVAQGMNKDFVCNDKYDNEIFEKVLYLRSNENWKEIDSFMGREYHGKWLDFKAHSGKLNTE